MNCNTHTHLFWMSPMTWEYVFPIMLSPFTFTNLSPVHKVPLSGFRLSDVDRQKERMYCTFVMMVYLPVQSPALWAGPPSLTCFTKIVSMGSSLFRGLPGNNKSSRVTSGPNHKPAPGKSERSQDWATINILTRTSFQNETFNPLRVRKCWDFIWMWPSIQCDIPEGALYLASSWHNMPEHRSNSEQLTLQIPWGWQRWDA